MRTIIRINNKSCLDTLHITHYSNYRTHTMIILYVHNER